jgi:hypothetical protein
LVAGLSAGPGWSAPPPAKADPLTTLIGGTSTEVLAGQLRTFVLDFLPDPLYEDAKNWGTQKAGPRGKMKNHGRWVKVRITGGNLKDNLKLRIDHVKKEPGRTFFTVFITLDANVLVERQTWKLGARVYSGETRARVRMVLTLNCELTSRVDQGTGWLPDMVFRLRVLQSAFDHEHPVVEHTAGVGGDAARLLGELLLGIVKAAKPNLERDLKSKVNAAILKAGDTKEVRVSLADLLAGKAPPLPAKKGPGK